MTDPTPEWKLDAFEWLPLARWNPSTILNFYEVKGRRLCKICDKWIIPKRHASHVKWHVKEREFILRQRKAAALEAAKQARIFAAEERRIEKEAMRLLGRENK